MQRPSARGVWHWRSVRRSHQSRFACPTGDEFSVSLALLNRLLQAADVLYSFTDSPKLPQTRTIEQSQSRGRRPRREHSTDRGADRVEARCFWRLPQRVSSCRTRSHCGRYRPRPATRPPAWTSEDEELPSSAHPLDHHRDHQRPAHRSLTATQHPAGWREQQQ